MRGIKEGWFRSLLFSDSQITHTVTSPIMKFLLAVITLLTSSVTAVQLQYDNHYDDSGASLATTACSDGPNGLLTRGYSTFGSLPRFPHIGAVDAITGWNSPKCGSCWRVTYQGRSINIIGVDVAGNGLNVAQAAMDELTNGQAVQLGNIQVDAFEVGAGECGL
ncbi:snodprot1 [Marasmius fiardii PR-910]|nr:snodprot1 [Marasmius fiardii PR-910]